MTVKLEKMWIGKFQDQREVRLYWSNDRHHAVSIQHPGGPDQVAEALKALSRLVFQDPHLRTATSECRYPECVDNEDERCPRLLTGECKGPHAPT